MLKIAGHELRVGYDGPTALAVATSFQPQIVLLDIGVPGLTGHAVAQQLRRTPETKKCHVSGYYRMGTTGGSAKVKGSWV